MSAPKSLFMDMDGCLCDFEGQCRTLFSDMEDSESCTEYKKRIGSNVFWRQIRDTDGEFWSTMEPMDADIVQVWGKLREGCPDISILSSPDDRDPKCIYGKNKWLDIHIGSGYPRIFRSDKYVHASPTSVLVDDLVKNTEPWQENGGHAILFGGKFDDAFWAEFHEKVRV